jgi:hypothetical protein
MGKLRLTSGAKANVLAHTHWIRLLNKDKHDGTYNHLVAGLLLLALSVMLWPVPVLLSFPCAARIIHLRGGLNAMLFGPSLPKVEVNVLPAYLEERRAQITAHCPLPRVLQDIVAGYAELSYDERKKVLLEGPKSREQMRMLSPVNLNVYCCGVQLK